METTFITIHNLSSNANILFASASISEILGYHPEEVTGKSCFEFFHPDEVPFARNIHSRGVQFDKAAVLHYARVKGAGGEWVGCECVFTVVYEVLFACTSIYRGDEKNERRAVEAPAIRRLFSASPRDPRYHMLEHLSSKFRTPPQASLLEPRAALILNRFTLTLTILYATSAVASVLGIPAEMIKNKSFYECIQRNCLSEAKTCLESAKCNDSIAYLRFWYRDPRREEDFEQELREASQSNDSEDGGVEFHDHMDVDTDTTDYDSAVSRQGTAMQHRNAARSNSQASGANTHDASRGIINQGQSSSSSLSSVSMSSQTARRPSRPPSAPAPFRGPAEPFEIEAVVSCTSDGLVVVLRRARYRIPQDQAGVFAAPWGVNAIQPHMHQPNPLHPFRHGFEAPAHGPPLEEFMVSIQEVAVFAWSLTGINGNIASYGRGIPRGESQPPGGLPIWDPYAQPRPCYLPPENQAAQRWSRERTNDPVEETKVLYQHVRQERNFRQLHGIRPGPVGSDVPGSTAYTHLTGIGDSHHNIDRAQNIRYTDISNEMPGLPDESNDQPRHQGPTEGPNGNKHR